jgi:chromosome segregation ATPase
MPETLDTLAEKVAALTTAMMTGFDGIDRRFDAVDRKFDAIDQRFDAIDQRFDAIDRRFDAIDRRFEVVDRKFDVIDRRFDAIDHRFEQVDQRFDELKAGLRTQIEAVDAKVDLVLEKLTDLTSRDIGHSVTHARFDERLNEHEVRLNALETKPRKPS